MPQAPAQAIIVAGVLAAVNGGLMISTQSLTSSATYIAPLWIFKPTGRAPAVAMVTAAVLVPLSGAS